MHRCQQHGALQETMVLHHISKEEGQNHPPPSLTLLPSWILRDPYWLIFWPLMLFIRFRQSKEWCTLHNKHPMKRQITSAQQCTTSHGISGQGAVKFSQFRICSFQTMKDYEPAIQEQCQQRNSAYMVVECTNGHLPQQHVQAHTTLAEMGRL